MKKEFLVILAIFVIAGFTSSAMITHPNSFYGEISYENNSIGSGCYVVLETSYGSENCLIMDSKYGYNPNVCVVETDDLSNEVVEFFINGQKIGEHNFNLREQTELNFNIDFSPDCTLPEPEENETNPDNQTDLTPGSSSSSSSGGSGGGGGGSSSSSSSGAEVISFENSNGGNGDNSCVENWACYSWTDSKNKCGERECVDLSNCGTENLKPETVKECIEPEGVGISGITGQVIGGINNFVGSKAGAPLLLALIVIVVAVLYFGFKKR